MKCESRNMDWTGILSVVEKQEFVSRKDDGKTDVVTTVMFRSRLGERLRARASGWKGEEHDEKRSLLGAWSMVPVQRSIEAIASRRTETQLGKAKEGMIVVLERLRAGGLGGVLDGMRRDGLMVVRE